MRLRPIGCRCIPRIGDTEVKRKGKRKGQFADGRIIVLLFSFIGGNECGHVANVEFSVKYLRPLRVLIVCALSKRELRAFVVLFVFYFETLAEIFFFFRSVFWFS